MTDWDLLRVEQRAYLLARDIRRASDRLRLAAERVRILAGSGRFGTGSANTYRQYYRACGGAGVSGVAAVLVNGARAIDATSDSTGRLTIPPGYSVVKVTLPGGYRTGTGTTSGDTTTYYLPGGPAWPCFPDFPTNGDFTLTYDYATTGLSTWTTQGMYAGPWDQTGDYQDGPYPDTQLPMWGLGSYWNATLGLRTNAYNLIPYNYNQTNDPYSVLAQLQCYNGAYALYVYGSIGRTSPGSSQALNWSMRFDLAPTTCAPTEIDLGDPAQTVYWYYDSTQNKNIPIPFTDARALFTQYDASGNLVSGVIADLPFGVALRNMKITTP